MSELLQIFTGNPLTTFIGKKIEAATKAELETEDWALNIEICDIINENDDDAKDAARAIKKRLQQIDQDQNFVITNRTLTLLDTCVSNCSHRFHTLVMTKDFIQDLVKLIGPKNNPPIELQERVLSLIERWADAFRNQPDLSGVVSVHDELKARGVTFPPRDPGSHVPIQTPQRSVPQQSRPETRPMQTVMPPAGPGGVSMMAGAQLAAGMARQRHQQQQPAGQVILEGEGYDKISEDLVVVQTSIEMFSDILKELESPASEETAWNLAGDMSSVCRQIKDRVVDLIERVANEDLTIELLRLNDELNNVFIKYESLTMNRSKVTDRNSPVRPTTTIASQPPNHAADQPALAESASSRRIPGVSSKTLNELSLIDFNAAGSVNAGNTLQHPATTQARSQAATGSTTANESSANYRPGTGLSLADSLNKINISESTQVKGKPSGLPEEVSSVREQDFAEIENWLSSDSGRNLASVAGDMPSIEPVSIPNEDFENFLASRARAGSNTTSANQQHKDTSQNRAHKESEPSS